jgi:hypothetical protein
MIRSTMLRLPAAMALAVILTACATPDPASAPGQATLSAPVVGGERGAPFGTVTLPPSHLEEERFLSGTATAYARAGEWGIDGFWEVQPSETAPFAVRMLVRRPARPEDFNGVVIVEWLNVTAMTEGAADFSQMEDEILRGGYAWVGVGAQAVGIHAPSTGLKAWDPVRYGPLAHPGDRFSYDIFAQAARAVRSGTGSGGPLQGLEFRHVIAAGRSQSAFRLVTYLNAFHLRDRVFDGYFVHSRGASAAGLTAEALAPDVPVPTPPGARIRSDIDVPVFDIQAEGDMTTLRSHLTRQPASDRYRRWELAGVAHAEIPLWVAEPANPPSLGPGCASPVNSAPHQVFVKAGLRALTSWVRDGTPPAHSPDIRLTDPAAADPIARDEHGNALGGVRIPQLQVPTATLDGIPNSVAAGAGGAQNFCRLFGRTVLFDRETLRRLYPTPESFVDPFHRAIDDLERAGYLLAPEAEAGRAAARASQIGRTAP